MLPYRIVRWINEIYPVTVLFLYIGLAALTFAICFLMPPAAIMSLIVAIFALIPAVTAWRLLKFSEHWLARTAIRADRCPECGYELAQDPDREAAPGSEDEDQLCPCCLGCGAAFTPDGSRVLT